MINDTMRSGLKTSFPGSCGNGLNFCIDGVDEMKLTDARDHDEVMRAVAENYPDEIEFEPGKIAKIDPDSGEWIYPAPDGASVKISL